MPTLTRRRVLGLAMLAATSTMFAADKKLEKALRTSTDLPTPFEVRRPVDALLIDLGNMLASYDAVGGRGRDILEIDYIGNETGSEKLPGDLGQICRNVLSKIGQASTYRALLESMASQRAGFNGRDQYLRDRPKPPEPTFRLTGSFERASEVVVKGRNMQGDGLYDHDRFRSDVQIGRDRTTTITNLTIALGLDYRDGTNVPGANAEYRIRITKGEGNQSFSIYVAGTGGVIGSRLIVSNETADAIYNTIAMGIIHVYGVAAGVPYYRISPDFLPNPSLEARMRDTYTRMTQSQIERLLKRYMVVDGFGLDRGRPDLSDSDRGAVLVEMRHRNLDSRDRTGWVSLLMQFWAKMDYRAGEQRVRQFLADGDRGARELAELQAREQESLTVSPMEFGWREDVRMVVVDVSRVAQAADRDRIVAALRTCRDCGEIRPHPKKALFGVSWAPKAEEVQYALRGLQLEFVWLNNAPAPRLLVIPVKSVPI